MHKASPVELRTSIEMAHSLAQIGIRFVPIPVETDEEFHTLANWGFDADLFHELVTPSIVLTLLDERERNQQYIKRRDQENEDIALTVRKLRVELETAKIKTQRAA
ncbi:DUF1382 family protein [Escherichia coli]|nr:DUF1382 family protein [Escherichia coli]